MAIPFPSLAPFAVEHNADYAIDFPIHVGFTLQCTGRGEIRGLPIVSAFRSTGGIGLSLWQKELPRGEFHRPVDAVVDPSAPIGSFSLRGGQSRRFLVDLGDLLPQGIRPGVYRAVLWFGEGKRTVASTAFELTLRAKTEQENDELEKLGPELKRCRSWGNWAMSAPQFNDRPLMLPKSEADPLRFNRTIRFLFFHVAPLATVDYSRLELLRNSVYAAQADLLLAEILHQKNADAFADHAQFCRKHHPGLHWWIEAIAAGKSTLIWRRKRNETISLRDSLSTLHESALY